jgi:sugar lactone lactonase YvrE
LVPRTLPLRRAAAAGLVLVLAGDPGQGSESIRTLGRRLSCSGDTLVLTEPDLNRIVLYDVSGPQPRKRLAFGDPGIKPGQLTGPHGALLEGSDVFVADTFNHRVQVFRLPEPPATRPRLVRTWADFGDAIGELRAPHSGFARASEGPRKGILFIPDTRNDRVQSFRASGEPAGIVLGARGAGEGQLDVPVAAAFDPAGTVLYVAESGNRRISVFDPVRARVLFTFSGEPEEMPFTPAGLAVDDAGTLYMTDVARRQVRMYRPVIGTDGLPRGLKAAGAWGKVGTGPGEWTYPQSVAVDGSRRVYVCDQSDGRCQFFAADGRYLGQFGDDFAELPGPPAPAASASPAGNDLFPPSVCSNDGTFRVTFVGEPPFRAPVNELFGFEIGIAEGCGAGARPLGEATVTVDAVMPQHRHGMNTQARVRGRGDGRYVVEGVRLHMSGHWEIHFDVARGGVIERAQIDVWIE